MRVGYSFWGFIGPGIVDTPDGGRSWRSTVLDHLAADHQLVLLQPNRDLIEAGHDLRGAYTFDAGFPELDALVLEWRWPLPGRNTTPCGTPGHTCDLHRQDELIAHYTHQGVRTLIWDLDQTLPAHDPLRAHPGVTVLEPALHPAPGGITLLTPVDDELLDHADPEQLAAEPRHWPLVYVGNQYDRDVMFDQFFAPAARVHPHQVAGKWTHTDAWPHVQFIGRIGFLEGQTLLRHAVTSLLLLPERYAAVGHMTQRLPECVLAGCLPIGPTSIRDIDHFVPVILQANDGDHAAALIADLIDTSSATRAGLLHDCVTKLDPFRASAYTAIVNGLLTASSNVSH